MKHRFVTLKALEAVNADKTITIDLDMVDPISEIYVDIRVDNGNAVDSTEHPVACVTKCEIIDGSDVLFSLDGYEMHALDIYHSGIHPRGGWYNYLINNPTDIPVAISFGRYLWDEELAFEPNRFGNPQLKITFDISAGGIATSTCDVAVHAALFDEKVITPSGFFMTKEVKRWTVASGSYEYTDLPLDHPYRKLFLQGRYTSIPPNWIFDNIKLSSDQDKKVILNGNYRDLMFGPCREGAYIKEAWISTGNIAQFVRHVTPCMDVIAAGAGWEETLNCKDIAFYDGDGGHLEGICEASHNLSINVGGWAPHGTLCIPFGKQGIIEDWFDLSGIGNLKLEVKSGNASAVQKAFIQQLRTY